MRKSRAARNRKIRVDWTGRRFVERDIHNVNVSDEGYTAVALLNDTVVRLNKPKNAKYWRALQPV